MKQHNMITILLLISYWFINTTTATSINYEDNNYLENEEQNLFSDFLENFDENYAELNKINELKFQESLLKCASSIAYSNTTSKAIQTKTFKHLCLSVNPYLDQDPGTLSGKLFSYDSNIIGLITNTEQSVRFYYFNPVQKSLVQIYKKVFHQSVPYAACVDKSKSIYLVFPDDQKIGKYVLETSVNSNGNMKVIKMREVLVRQESDYNPSTASCFDGNLYVSERPSNNVRVYDSNLNVVKNIEINGIVISAHRAIDVNQNIRIFADDSSGIGLFNPVKHSEDVVSYACHFFYKRNCIEDVFSIAENRNRTLIYVADSCSSEVKQFIYTNNRNIDLVNDYASDGIPTSILANEYGYLFVLTSVPSRINIYYPRQCKNQNTWMRRQMN